MIYALVKLDFFSPYTSVPFLAEHGRGNIAPPPSTLIGALAAAYFYPNERDVFDEVASKVRYVSFWVPPYAFVENISRHFSVFSQRPQRLKVISAAMEVLKTKALSDDVIKEFRNYGGLQRPEALLSTALSPIGVARTVLQVLYQPASRLEVYYYGPAYVLYVLDDEELAKRAGYLFRIGPKESLVSATPLRVYSVEKHRGEVRTRFYLPASALGGRCGEGFLVNYMAWRPGGDPFNAEIEPFCLPRPFDEYMELVNLADGWVPLEIKTEEGEFQAVVPEHAAP
jgi:CRISPR-associated protein Cas5a/b/c